MSTGTKTTSSNTKALLTAGMIGGPFYVGVSLIQALTRDGFDMQHHAFSLLSVGDLGWIQVLNFVVAGSLLIAGAVGVRRVLGGQGKASKWGPRLLGFFGAGAVTAGIFKPDPALGFPAGTPADANDISWHGFIHFGVASLAFIALIAACFVMARRFTGAWATWTRVLGVVLIVTLLGISSGSASKNDFVTPAFIAAASLGYLWCSAVAAKLKGEVKA